MLQYIAPAIWFVSLTFAVISFYLQNYKDKKNISYIHLHKSPSSPNKHDPNLKIAYNWAIVENVVIHDLAFFNYGKEAVEKEDLTTADKKIKLRFSNSCKVLWIETWHKSNENIDIDIERTNKDNELLLEFNYLNKGDGFIIKIITDSKDSELKILWEILNWVLKKYDISLFKQVYPISKFVLWLLVMATIWCVTYIVLSFLLNGTTFSPNIKSTIIGMITTVSVIFIPSYIHATYGSILEEFISAPFVGKKFYWILVMASYAIDYDDMELLGIKPDDIVNQKEIIMKHWIGHWYMDGKTEFRSIPFDGGH